MIKEQGFGEMAKNGKVAMFYGGAADELDYAHAKDPKIRRDENRAAAQGPQDGQAHDLRLDRIHVVSAPPPRTPTVAYKALIALTDGIQHWKMPRRASRSPPPT